MCTMKIYSIRKKQIWNISFHLDAMFCNIDYAIHLFYTDSQCSEVEQRFSYIQYMQLLNL